MGERNLKLKFNIYEGVRGRINAEAYHSRGTKHPQPPLPLFCPLLWCPLPLAFLIIP